MALKGTLKDFGIADILQLIGQQQKTGTLVLKQKPEEIHVSFRDGNIVRAETSSRNKKDLIGSMLVRANLITETQLAQGLEIQKRTLQRLGDVLVDREFLTAEKFKEMVQLQTSETLYTLFGWKTGNYAFEQGEVEDLDPTFVPLRAESVLMEGFRRVDEWPVVRKRITSYQMTFERLKELPPPPLQKDDFDSALDDAFAEEKKSENKGEFQSVGSNERRCYELVQPGRPVQDIIDQSCLGEFETAKALTNLVNLEYLKALAPAGGAKNDFDPDSTRGRVVGMLARVGVSVLVIGGLLFLVTRMDLGPFAWGGSSGTTFTDPALKRFVSTQQMSRIGAALELYRLEKGGLPTALSDLAELGFLSADDLRYPWHDAYYYRRVDPKTYTLLPPLR